MWLTGCVPETSGCVPWVEQVNRKFRQNRDTATRPHVPILQPSDCRGRGTVIFVVRQSFDVVILLEYSWWFSCRLDVNVLIVSIFPSLRTRFSGVYRLILCIREQCEFCVVHLLPGTVMNCNGLSFEHSNVAHVNNVNKIVILYNSERTRSNLLCKI